MTSDYSRLIPFDSDDPEFARGFEAGRVYTLLEADEFGDVVVHATNAEMVMRIAERHGLRAHVEDRADTFVHVRFVTS